MSARYTGLARRSASDTTAAPIRSASALRRRVRELEVRLAEREAECDRLRAANRRLSVELADLRGRFLRFVRAAAEDARARAEIYARLIDETQRGTVWKLKRLFRGARRR